MVLTGICLYDLLFIYLLFTLAADRFNQIDDRIDRVLLRGLLHGIDVFLTVLIYLIYRCQKALVCHRLFFQNNAEALAFK